MINIFRPRPKPTPRPNLDDLTDRIIASTQSMLDR